MDNQFNNQNVGQDNPYYVHYTQPENQPVEKAKAVKVRKPLSSKTLVAIALVGALVLGIIGGGIGASLFGNVGSTVIYKSTSSPVEISDSEDSTLSTAQVAAKTKDSVVEIKTETMTTGSFFQNYVTSGAGSGVIVSKDGYIVTNNHVIEGASKISVTSTAYPEKQFTAEVVGTDKTTDIAVLKLENLQKNFTFTPAVFGDSDKLVVGQSVVAIGNPLGELGGTVTKGIISALGRELTVENQSMTLLQIDASINPGNSGGGLFDGLGNLVGIVNAKSSGSDVEGLGFAIPINVAQQTIDDIINYGYVKGRPQLGVTTVSVSDIQTAYMYGVSELGVYIYSVNKGSGAEKAGLQSGDRIVAIDGKEVSEYSDLSAQLQTKKVGQVVTVTYARNGEKHKAKVKLQEAKPSTEDSKK